MVSKIQVEEDKPSISHVSGYQIQNDAPKPTSGPWSVEEYRIPGYERRITVGNAQNLAVCDVLGAGSSNVKVLLSVRANARLIAAAPDLLAAAKAALKYVDNLNEEAPTYATCPECTSGSVPEKWNEGLCWIHQLEDVVRCCEGGQ